MLLSLGLILLLGFSLTGIFNRLKIPGIIAMILTGFILGPFLLNLIDPSILNISSELRKIALIIILLKAGLSLDIKSLKEIGKSGLLISILPSTLEICIITFLAHNFMSISYLESLILGTVIVAISPAIIVPKMLQLINEKYGRKKNIPKLLIAAASLEDIYVIILFTTFLSMYIHGGFNQIALFSVPISIITGTLLGFTLGFIFHFIFKKFEMRDTVKALVVLSITFTIVAIEPFLQTIAPISSLVSVVVLGIMLLRLNFSVAQTLLKKYTQLWIGAEMILFVLIGAAVNIKYFGTIGLNAIILIFIGLLFRTIGVYISLLKSKYNYKEKIFIAISYLPKATVQAALASIPLSYGMSSGNIILAIAVLTIIITAPLGSICIEKSYKKLLTKE